MMVLLAICIGIIFANSVQGFSLDISANMQKIEKGQEVTVRVSWDEEASAARTGFEV